MGLEILEGGGTIGTLPIDSVIASLISYLGILTGAL